MEQGPVEQGLVEQVLVEQVLVEQVLVEQVLRQWMTVDENIINAYMKGNGLSYKGKYGSKAVTKESPKFLTNISSLPIPGSLLLEAIDELPNQHNLNL